MPWLFAIAVVVVAALLYAYIEHRTQSRRLANLFAPIALTYDGTVTNATTLALPQLRFERAGRRYLIGAMASAGPLVSGTASRPGFTGAFTFADLELQFDTGQDLRIQRADALDRGARKLMSAVGGSQQLTSGDDAFDGVFQIRSGSELFVRRVLDSRLRQKLLASPHRRLEVTLKDAKISVHVDDYVKSAADLDDMIEIAALLADNCSGP